MGDQELRYPEWQVPLQDLILEFDRVRLSRKMQEIETIIVQRLEELSRKSDSRDEREALNDALSILRVIKRDRLRSLDQQ
jgi:hypothetical protein